MKTHSVLHVGPTNDLAEFLNKDGVDFKSSTGAQNYPATATATATMAAASHHLLLLHLVLYAATAHSATHHSDASALAAFKAAIAPTSIPPWSCLASWNFSDDPCRPVLRTHFVCGLTCSASASVGAAARVTAVVLDPVAYSGPISPALAALTALLHLDLADNSFHGPIPASLLSLPNLLTLSLRANFLSGPLPAAVSNLKSLRSLDLSRNALAGNIPSAVSDLADIRTLDLSFNRFAGGVPPVPRGLAVLALRGNLISGELTAASFKFAAALEVVELAENRLAGELGAWFFALPSLQQADLSNNSFASLAVPASGGSSDLVALDLGYNSIAGAIPAALAGFPSLSALSLRHNRLQGGIPAAFGRKGSAIRRLYLDGNFLKGKVPAGLDGGGVTGSLADNCLESCRSNLCSGGQKSAAVCRQMYQKKKPSLS